MIQAYKQMFSRAFDFGGRTSRSEFWWAYLANLIVVFAIGMVNLLLTLIFTVISEDAGVIVGGLISAVTGIYSLIILIPSVSMGVRRFHDIGKSTAMYFLLTIVGGCCCGIGTIVAFVFFCFPGVEGPNEFGPDPNNRTGSGSSNFGNQFNGYGQTTNNYGGMNGYGQAPNNMGTMNMNNSPYGQPNTPNHMGQNTMGMGQRPNPMGSTNGNPYGQPNNPNQMNGR